jgi:hypothetical protein
MSVERVAVFLVHGLSAMGRKAEDTNTSLVLLSMKHRIRR